MVNFIPCSTKLLRDSTNEFTICQMTLNTEEFSGSTNCGGHQENDLPWVPKVGVWPFLNKKGGVDLWEWAVTHRWVRKS
jgi:hypothetical protein